MSDFDDGLFEDEQPVLVWSDAELARAVALMVYEADIEELDEQQGGRAPNYDW